MKSSKEAAVRVEFAPKKSNSHLKNEISESQSIQMVSSEEEFTHFFYQTLELMCIVDFDGYFKQLNPAWATHMGWTKEELQAKPFLDFVHPPTVDCFKGASD